MFPLFRNPGSRSSCHTCFMWKWDHKPQVFSRSQFGTRISVDHVHILSCPKRFPTSIWPPTPACLQESNKAFLSLLCHDTTSPLYLQVRAWWPKESKEWVGQNELLPPKLSILSHHLIDIWHSSLSRWRFWPGDGTTESQEAARLEETRPYFELRKHQTTLFLFYWTTSSGSLENLLLLLLLFILFIIFLKKLF